MLIVINGVCRVVENALQGAQPAHAQPLQHLRRFVRLEHLPDHLKNDSASPFTSQTGVASADREDEGEEEDRHDEVLATSPGRPILHLLVCAATDLTLRHVQALLASDSASDGKNSGPPVFTVTVPGLPPTSEAQAKRWSQEYWPTIYRKHNSFGAHPATISRAAAEMEGKVGGFMDLARRVGREALEACIGEDVGVVVIDRSTSGRSAVVMVAGDARWNLTGKCPTQESGNGNVMAHAVMRAIGLIAKKRHDVSTCPTIIGNDEERDAFAGSPLTLLEKEAYSKSSIVPGGYLCLDLEFYLTHEPCVMCSMALLHSRVGRVIFEKRMRLTGGLTAGDKESEAEDAPGLSYGLFWRPSLNWKFLTWQWRLDDHRSPSHSVYKKMHA